MDRLRNGLAWVLIGLAALLAIQLSWPQTGEEWRTALPPVFFDSGDLAELDIHRDLVLRTPVKAWLGQEMEVDLTLTPGAEPVDLPAGSWLVAQARLDFPGFDVQPVGEVIEPLSAAGTARFHWTLSSSLSGRSEGRLWLYIQRMDEENHPNSPSMVLARPVIIGVQPLYGMTHQQAWTLAGLLVGLSFILLGPWFRTPKP